MKTNEEKISFLELTLFKKEVESRIKQLNNKHQLKKILKEDEKNFNLSFYKDVDSCRSALQGYIDAYYWNYYEVDGFEYMRNDDTLEYCINKNLSLLKSMIKLFKFANI